MDRDQFTARLRAEGYPEVRINELEPNRRNAEHQHPFDVLALVLEGERNSRCRRAAATSTSARKA